MSAGLEVGLGLIILAVALLVPVLVVVAFRDACHVTRCLPHKLTHLLSPLVHHIQMKRSYLSNLVDELQYVNELSARVVWFTPR